jgi:hypothetical protein
VKKLEQLRGLLAETSLRESGYERMKWIHVAQDTMQRQAHVNTVMDCQSTQKAGNSSEQPSEHGVLQEGFCSV